MGKKATEREERYFVTGNAPTTIPLSNIQYAYPVVEQKNFYIKESNKGFIRLKRGQNYLFEDKNWTTTTLFTDDNGQKIETDFNYNPSDNEVSFTIPKLDKAKHYTFSIAAKTAKSSDTETKSIQQRTLQVDKEKEQGLMIETEYKKAQNLSKNGSLERLAFTFRTSKYNTLSDKIDKINFTTIKGRISTDLVYLQNNMNTDEAFDKVELVGSRYTDNKPLISVEALMDDRFADKFKRWVYNEYPLEDIRLKRDTPKNKEGIPPTKALPLVTSYLNYLQDQIYHVSLSQIFPYKYDLFRLYKSDWYETVSGLTKLRIVQKITSPKINEVINSNFGVIPDGKYTIKMNYILPNGTVGSSKKVVYKMKSNYL